jgi:hypothetical protein
MATEPGAGEKLIHSSSKTERQRDTGLKKNEAEGVL